MSWLSLGGKRAVVTGGASGIGRATAEALLKAGASVTILDRNQTSVDKVVEEMQSFADGAPPGSAIFGAAVDVSSTEMVSAYWDQAGPAHILCNCAGITKDGWLTRMDEATWDDVLNVNLKGTFLMTQAFARQQAAHSSEGDGLASEGSVVNISSIVGKMGNMGQSNYAASKAGVIGFTKSAAKELAASGVRVNVILPGFIATPMTEAVPDKVLAKIIPTIPAGRMGDPSDIADAALFLASERSKYMTGAVLEVAGGLAM